MKKICMVPQLGFHIFIVLHSSSAEIGNSFLFTVSGNMLLFESQSRGGYTDYVCSEFPLCQLNNIIALKFGFNYSSVICHFKWKFILLLYVSTKLIIRFQHKVGYLTYFDESIAIRTLNRTTLLYLSHLLRFSWPKRP